MDIFADKTKAAGEKRISFLRLILFIPASNEPSGHAGMSIWRLPRGSLTCSEIHAKKVLTRMLYGTGVFLVVILGILASQSEMTGAGGIESIGVRVWFVLLESLLTLLFINSLAKIKELYLSI